MLNLLKFDGDRGEPLYRWYLTNAKPIIERIGGWVLYAGTLTTSLVSVEGDDWDAVVLIVWPQRQMLAELARDPEYRRLNEEGRLASLSTTSLRASSVWTDVCTLTPPK